MPVNKTHSQYSLATVLIFMFLAAVVTLQATVSVSGQWIGGLVGGVAVAGFIFGARRSLERAVHYSIRAVLLLWVILLLGILLAKLGI